MTSNFLQRLSTSAPMILDGAIGTELLKTHPTRIADIINIDDPKSVIRILKSYIEAGAEIIKTNTFNSCEPIFYDRDLCKWMTIYGVAIAQKVAKEYSACKNPVFVAGSIGPSTIRLSEIKRTDIEKFNSFKADLIDVCRMVATIMIEEGCDLLLVETAYDFENLCATLEALESTIDELSAEIPIAVSLTVDPTTMTIASGESLSDVIKHIDRFPIAMLGVNCVDYQRIAQVAISLRALTDKPLILSPSINDHDQQGLYTDSPDDFAICMAEAIRISSPAIVGGCCGTTPAHIRALSDLVLRDFR